MDIHTDTHDVHRLEVVDTGRRRRWSLDKKFRIIEESLAGEASVSAVARRHGLSPTQLFAWRKAAREGRLGDTDAIGFVPAVIRPEPVAQPVRGGRMEVVCAHGRRVIVGPDVDTGALVRVLEALERQ